MSAREITITQGLSTLRVYPDAGLGGDLGAVDLPEWIKSAKLGPETQRLFDALNDILRLQKEHEAVVAELEDWKNAARGAMDERCGANEVHCTCVPLLRAAAARWKDLATSLAAALSAPANDGYPEAIEALAVFEKEGK